MPSPKVDCSAMTRKSCCFDESFTRDFMIDDFKVCVYPRRLDLCHLAARGRLIKPADFYSSSAELGLKGAADVSLKGFAGHRILSWKSALGTYSQHVKGRPPLVVDMNLIRAARAALPHLKERVHRRLPTNGIDTRVVSRSEVRRLGFEFLAGALPVLRGEYCAIFNALWGVALAEEDVRFSFNEIELAWDVFSPEGASLATRRFAASWHRCLAEGGHVIVPELLRDEADGTLRAVGESGANLKLYPKGGEFIRFEAQLSKKDVAGLVGRVPTPSDLPTFQAALDAVADKVFPEVLRVQAEVGTPPRESLVALLVQSLPGTHLPRLYDALLTTGQVKIYAADSAARDALVKLRDRGIVEIGKGRKGVWVLTPQWAHLAQFVRRTDAAYVMSRSS